MHIQYHEGTSPEGWRMKTAWVTGKKRIEVIDTGYTRPERDEVVVQIKACGICGTDLHFYNDFPGNAPIPLGHEVSGVVHEVGDDVSGFTPGQTVIVQNHIPCRKCSMCLMGNIAHCRNIQTYMNERPAMAEFIRVKRDMVVPFSNLSHVEAAIAEPLTVALDLMREAKVQPFQNVCISGPGIIGLFCTKLARIRGAKNIVVLGRGFKTGRGKARREAAIQMGAAVVADTDEPGWKETVKRSIPDGFERIIITSPPRTIPELFELASFGASIVFNGISFSEESISFNANAFHFQKLRLIASHAIPNWGFPLALDLLVEKTFDYRSFVTHQFPFNEIEEAFKAATNRDEGVIKVVVTF